MIISANALDNGKRKKVFNFVLVKCNTRRPSKILFTEIFQIKSCPY